MSATVLDVARACKASPGVVNRVLNTAGADVGAEERARILAAAEELGFEASPHTYNLGVLFMDESAKGLTHPYFSAVLNAFKIEAEKRGYDVTFVNQTIGRDTMSYLEYCQYRELDGVCLACIDFDDPQVVELVKSGIPCVTVDHIFKRVPSILSDNEIGVQKLVEYAISLGHTRIAMIHGHNNSVVTRTRIRQFFQTMEYHGFDVPDDYVRAGLYSDIALTRELVNELLTLPERPSCILLPDDLCYLGAQEAARELGLRIPEDVSFAGYDGIPAMQAISPKLTTVRQNSDRIGEEAASKLIALIEEGKHVSWLPVVLPVELIEGGTLARL